MMRSQPTIPVQSWGPTPAAPSFPILESKLTPAPTRPGLVSRARLLDWLEASAATPVVVICAPAGYGKTILAAEWAERDRRPFVWLSIDRHDNDPAVLLTYLAMGWTGSSRSTPGCSVPWHPGPPRSPTRSFRRSRPRCPARRSR